MAEEISHFYPAFPKKEFIKVISRLEELELKARVLLVTQELKKCLPKNYLESLNILMEVMKREKLKGFDLWPFSEYIGQYGLDHFDESLQAMHLLTQKFTAEFAIRPFLLKDSQKALDFLRQCINDSNYHVRRWVSEGTRPLLPWGQRLPEFIADPYEPITLLEQLKYDSETYVRKSVANHLNDISKHHPDLVINILRRWETTCPSIHQDKIQWIKRQALRTLIKRGNKKALELMGVAGPAKVKLSPIVLKKKQLHLGDKLEFQFKLSSIGKKSQKLVIDYLIDFQKANGTTNPKVFKLKTIELQAGETIVINKSHNLRKITTMTYYSGTHKVMIQINGKVLGEKAWFFNI